MSAAHHLMSRLENLFDRCPSLICLRLFPYGLQTETSMSDHQVTDFIKVSGRSPVQSIASVLARAVVAGERPPMRAIGASAVNQAVKACAIARGFVAPRGIDLCYQIYFDDVVGENGDSISAICIRPVIR